MEKNTSTYYCPECEHNFEQGEWDYNYDTANLDFECPCCGWYGTYYDVIDEDDESNMEEFEK
jgi:hypothetical protein